jgi:hypothetical protein
LLTSGSCRSRGRMCQAGGRNRHASFRHGPCISPAPMPATRRTPQTFQALRVAQTFVRVSGPSSWSVVRFLRIHMSRRLQTRARVLSTLRCGPQGLGRLSSDAGQWDGRTRLGRIAVACSSGGHREARRSLSCQDGRPRFQRRQRGTLKKRRSGQRSQCWAWQRHWCSGSNLRGHLRRGSRGWS